MNAAILALALLAPAQPIDAGVLPLGADGKPLNLDFETGTLKDWTADGAAFKGQPIEGDVVAKRRGDMKSRHQGKFWIGGFEKVQDRPVGTLTSVPFKVTHRWATFLVGGGPHEKETCVEIVQGKDVIFRAAGLEEEDMQRVLVDLGPYMDREIFIRVVDKHTGHWGHVNFDDFRFHSMKPKIAERPKAQAALATDTYKFAGLSPQQAAKVMTVPDGFSVKLFAGEPDVHQPVAMCTDDRGRLWVVEAHVYPRRLPFPGALLPEAERKKGDKILIFEDTDGDGQFDRRAVFIEGLNLVSGIELGFGGVWVGAAPYLMFIPDKNRDDKPDAEPEILLDGWGLQDTHETLNAFIWGPDGWLYGCHGVFTHSKVGKPGLDKDDPARIPINAGIWRYHPTKHTFEVFCHGTSNPWGLDYNEHGEFFIEACVIPHMWHMIQGGRYQRQGGTHFNPYTFDDIKTIALHRHYLGATPHGGNGKSDSAGGGHAHCGLMCYQGGAWPKEYHGKLFMGNLHGHRLNVDVLKPKGSGYEADRNPDFLLSNDKWFMPITIMGGPDGNVYVSDWYDQQICHLPQPEKWDRTNGRIYKIVHKDTKPVVGLDLQKCTAEELVNYQLHENQWYVRHARRILQERVEKMTVEEKRNLQEHLVKLFKAEISEASMLHALWTLHVSVGLPDKLIQAITQNTTGRILGWNLRLSEGDGDGFDERIMGLGIVAPKPEARRFAASALQRVKPTARIDSLSILLRFEDDSNDHNLPFLYWYALEPLTDVDAARALKLAMNGKVPQLVGWAARKIGMSDKPEAIGLLVKAAGEAKSAEQQVALLQGIQAGLRGKRQFPMPKEWDAAFPALIKSENAAVRSQAQALAVVFGDKAAFAALRKVLADSQANTEARISALNSLVAAKDLEVPSVLFVLIKQPSMRGAAIRGLAAFDDPKTPDMILAVYGTLNAAEKRDALSTLSARVGYAKAMMKAMADKKIPPSDVSAETVRQLRNLQDKDLDKAVAELWGSVRETAADRKKLITEWKAKLEAKTPVDLNLGRTVFAKTCQQCHTLYGVGGKVGPDITGANRSDLNYVLENVLDPSAIIPKEYAATRIATVDDRVITGIVKEETKAALTVVTATETVTVPVADIASRKPSELSMMPDDILKTTNEAEFKALVGYLRHAAQVPMLATPDNAKDFFNGKDLTGWDGDKDVWSVVNGEIVGKTEKGLKHNNFLKSNLAVENFKLSLKVKLTPNSANSGIQFRSVPIEGGEMRGPQADIGAGWWGKLYEENGRAILADKAGDEHVKKDDWNDYVIEAHEGDVRIAINGKIVTDYFRDDKLARRGVIGFQVHSGGPTDVRFKDIKLEVLK
jgi:putative membrane-bound dehydrogenase-like protein